MKYKEMSVKRKYVSKIMEAIHEDAQNMYKVGAISKERMEEYDKDCLVKPPRKISKPVKTRTAALKKKTVARKYVKTAQN